MIKYFGLYLYQAREDKMEKRFTKDSYLPPCVYLSHPQPTPPFRTFGNKKKRFEADYIFIHKNCQVFSLYTAVLSFAILRN